MGILDTPFNKNMAVYYDGLASANGLKIVGRNFGWIDGYQSGGTDIGGTCRFTYKTVGALSKVGCLLASHGWVTGVTGGRAEGTVSSRRIWMSQTAYEYASNTTYDALYAKPTAVVFPNSPAVATDGVGINIPAATNFFVRHYIKIANLPSGTPTALAILGGSLAAHAWYYVITRTENGIESGPTAEFTATTSASNLAVAITIVDTASASADYYSIYRSSAAAGTKQFLGSTNGRTKRFVDDGSYTVDTTINPPAASTYDFNRIACISGDCSSHVSSTGTGENFVSATGPFTNSGFGFVGGVAPLCVVGDDRSGKSVLWLGDSICAGKGFAKVSGIYPQTKNMVDLSFSDGEINSLNASFPGSSLREMMRQTISGGARSRLKLITYADYVIDQHGTNDLAVGTTFLELASDKLALAAYVKRFGGRFVITTITPRVTTTNGCVTVASQTVGSIETDRIAFNSWVRAGSPVDVNGVPDMAGQPSALIHDYIDLAAPFEVNASNVITLNGGFWKAPSAPVFTGLVLNGSPTTSSLPVTTTLTFNENVSRVIKMTSGAANGQYAVVFSNTTTAFTLYNSGQTTLQSGVAVPFLANTPAAGDTCDVYDVMANEGLHPSVYGHAQLAAVIRAWLLANVI